MNRLKNIKQLAFLRRYSASNKYDWEFINPHPVSRENDLTIPTPPPIVRINEPLESKKRRLLWASRKRGILETDLLLSTFISKNLDTLTPVELEQYDKLLDENDWDIYYWTTGAKKVPEHIQAMHFWSNLVEHCKNNEKKVLRMPEL